jgi:Transposase DDE domain
MAFIDSTPLAVWHNRRSNAHRVFAGGPLVGRRRWAGGYGFQRHLIVHDAGERLAFSLTPGHVDARKPVPALAQRLLGQLFGDRASISQVWYDTLFAQGLALLTTIRKNMKNRLMPLRDKLWLCQRARIDTINDQLQHISQIEHTRHRSVTGFMVHLVARWAAYCYQPQKPSLGLRSDPRLPVCVM